MLSGSSRPATRGAYRSLAADPVFRRLMPVFALSDLGDGAVSVAVVWLALTLDGAGLAGLAVGAYVLPGAISAVALGRWLRPLSARRLVIADAVVRGALLGAIPAAYVLGALTPAVYVALLGLSSLLHAWGKAGRQALFVPLLPERLRLAANAVLSTSLWVSTIAGPVAAGVLAGVASPVWIVGADAVTFVAVAVRVWHTLLPEADGAVPPRSAVGRPVLFRRPELVGSMALTWFFNLSFGPVEVALPLFVSRTLRGGPALLGAYWAAIGALGLAAARRLPLWPAMLGVIAGHGLALLPFAVSGSAVPSLTGFTVAGVIYGPYTALSLSHLQEQVAPQDLTTVLAARSAVLLTAAPLGAFAGGAVVDRIGAPVLLAGCGAAMLAIATASALVLATRSRTAGESVVARPPTEA